MILRLSMERMLPPEIRWNTRRGRQAADVALRLLDYPSEAESVLDRLEASLDVTERVDVAMLRKTWRSLQASVTPQTAQQATVVFLRGAMAGLILLHNQKSS